MTVISTLNINRGSECCPSNISVTKNNQIVKQRVRVNINFSTSVLTPTSVDPPLWESTVRLVGSNTFSSFHGQVANTRSYTFPVAVSVCFSRPLPTICRLFVNLTIISMANSPSGLSEVAWRPLFKWLSTNLLCQMPLTLHLVECPILNIIKVFGKMES